MPADRERNADWAMLAIVAVLFLVVLVGFLTLRTPWRPVVGAATEASACTACSGTAVCAAKDGVVSTYENACAAQCAGATLVFPDACELIPRQ